jgi:hypothetical protein
MEGWPKVPEGACTLRFSSAGSTQGGTKKEKGSTKASSNEDIVLCENTRPTDYDKDKLTTWEPPR